MHNRRLPGKWFLILTCLVMAFCLVQRAAYLHHFLADVGARTQAIPFSAQAQQLSSEEAEPCPRLSAESQSLFARSRRYF
jgi:hypothetical protein